MARILEIADWDIRFAATADMNEDEATFDAKSLISSVDDVPLVSTVTDKCSLRQTEESTLLVTNHFVPGVDADYALWTDNPYVLRELGAGWVDLGSQSDGKKNTLIGRTPRQRRRWAT